MKIGFSIDYHQNIKTIKSLQHCPWKKELNIEYDEYTEDSLVRVLHGYSWRQRLKIEGQGHSESIPVRLLIGSFKQLISKFPRLTKLEIDGDVFHGVIFPRAMSIRYLKISEFDFLNWTGFVQSLPKTLETLTMCDPQGKNHDLRELLVALDKLPKFKKLKLINDPKSYNVSTSGLKNLWKCANSVFLFKRQSTRRQTQNLPRRRRQLGRE